MQRKPLYLETYCQNPAYNLAFEEVVLTHRKDRNYLILWQNANTIVIGQNQNAAEEINAGFVAKHGIHVVRRSTGGGAVYHDLGNLNYSFITPIGAEDEMSIAAFSEPVVRVLCSLGANAEQSGRNDILIDGKKVSGTAQRVLKDRILHHGTLLFSSDAAMISGALNADPTKFESKSTKSVVSRVGNIKDALPEDMDLPAFWAVLKRELGGEPTALTPAEIEEVVRLKEEKYDTYEWTYGRAPVSTMKAARRFPGGKVEVFANIKKGEVADISFYGDFLSRSPLSPLEAALAGIRFEKEAFRAVLSRFALADYFGAIANEELLSLLFD